MRNTRTYGRWRFEQIFAMTGGWASVPTEEGWRRPFKFMGPIEYGRKPKPRTKVSCEIEETELETESGRMIESVLVHCSRCDHTTESFGIGDRSVRRCLVLMREECPMKQQNFYIVESEYE